MGVLDPPNPTPVMETEEEDEEDDEEEEEEEEEQESKIGVEETPRPAKAHEKNGGEEVVVVVDDPTPQIQRDINTTPPSVAHVTRLQAQHPVAPIQVAPHSTPPFQTPPQVVVSSLNSRRYTNRISLFIFLLHLLIATAAIGFFIFKAIQVLLDPHTHKAEKERRHLHFWLPPIEGSALLSIILAFAWQISIRSFPSSLMINFVLWSTFFSTLTAGILLLCFAMPETSGIGVALVLFSLGTSLYNCWVLRRVPFTATVFEKALQPVAKFRDLNGPAYLMMAAGFLWVSVWCLAVIGAKNFYYPALTIMGLVLSLMWTVEVMRNVVNLTVSRVIALYYLRGMQSNTQFCFQRALSYNLGSACLGSLFVPTIEALRIMARGINLLEEEDEFMFSCAHCCLRVMEFVFQYGNSWAFVHIAAYGQGFVAASRSTWGLFERLKMEEMVDSDMTSSVCFLSGICSGALCMIFAASLTYATHRQYTVTVSLLAFFVGYLMTRIAMALPYACVACYYICYAACYAENPGSKLFDSTIPDRLERMRKDQDIAVPTPRFPRPFAST